MMNLTHLPEPELEFGGGGHHIDIRFGIMNHGPLDVSSPTAPKRIRLGVIGSAEGVEGTRAWLEQCRDGVAAKESRQPNLFPRFPGCRPDTGFHTELCIDERSCRTIPSKALRELAAASDYNRMIRQASELFLEEVRFLVQETDASVIVCAVPSEVVPLIDREEGPMLTPNGETNGAYLLTFHDLLKAKAMRWGRPLQVLRPTTFGGKVRRKRQQGRSPSRRLQDDATRAWNFHTAIYYKARGVPWRLPRVSTDLTACFIGVSFFRTLDRTALHTSVAQVFNQRGDGVVVRGGPAAISREDRTPYLVEADAHQLLTEALRRYRAEHKTSPARVVVHKSSRFRDEELRGFRAALDSEHIDRADFLTAESSRTRLFRAGVYPPLRGAVLSLDDNDRLLYTRGSVHFFATYPGLYVPQPLHLHRAEGEESPHRLAMEVLALTKMNWNNTQFDNKWPITLRAARQVGGILRHLEADDPVEPHYSYYM
jgi:hypothetical protein